MLHRALMTTIWQLRRNPPATKCCKIGLRANRRSKANFVFTAGELSTLSYQWRNRYTMAISSIRSAGALIPLAATAGTPPRGSSGTTGIQLQVDSRIRLGSTDVPHRPRARRLGIAQHFSDVWGDSEPDSLANSYQIEFPRSSRIHRKASRLRHHQRQVVRHMPLHRSKPSRNRVCLVNTLIRRPVPECDHRMRAGGSDAG